MVKRIETSCDRWEFSEEEGYNAMIFTDLQTKHIQNELGILAENSINLQYNPESPNAKEEFINQKQFFAGGITYLKLLLAMSDEKKNALQEKLKEQSELNFEQSFQAPQHMNPIQKDELL